MIEIMLQPRAVDNSHVFVPEKVISVLLFSRKEEKS